MGLRVDVSVNVTAFLGAWASPLLREKAGGQKFQLDGVMDSI
jgi:hypothetical protein